MDMNNKPEKSRRQSSADDAYWAALFQNENSSVPPVTPPEENWTPITERADGRFRWSDGGQPDHDTPWQLALEILESDQILQLRVVGYNKGGLLVSWNNLQGFVPASQLVDFPQFHVERERIQALSKWQDRVLKLKVIEVNQESNRLILSERAAEVRAEDREYLFNDLTQGDVIHGKVIVKPGERVRVQVLNIDRQTERIALSMKRLKHDPWSTAEERYQPGQMVTGVISNVANFGAFVWLEEELEGLIHISELAEGAFLHPRNVVRKGDRVTARVLHVDSTKKRLALSLRNTTE